MRVINKRASELIEKIGVFTAKTGFSPAVGRIMAYLMVAEPPQKSFEEIQTDLQLSKSAVSTALGILQMHHLVEYITIPSERKRYFRIDMEGWFQFFKLRLTSRPMMEELLRETLAIRTAQYPEMNALFEKTKAFYDFMVQEMQQSLEKWELQEKNKM